MTDQPDKAPNIHGLQTVDRDTLTPLVRQALNSQNYEIIDWDYKPVHGGAGDRGAGLSGIYRFAGNGRENGQTIPWSLILKVIGSPAQGGDPQGGTRERMAYQSGVLNNLTGSLRAARCFHVVEQGEGVSWLWLEEVANAMNSQWSLEHYGLVASHLGQFNGTYSTKKALPDWPWLSRDWIRTLIAPNAMAMSQLGDVLDHPLVSRWYPDDVANNLVHLWADREIFLAALEHVPQTFCHRDAFSANLFICRDGEGSEQIVAIDWAFAGIGAIGEEIGPLIQTAQSRGLVESAKTELLDSIVFNSYLDGLSKVGWNGNPQAVRFGYAASSALRYGLGFNAQVLDILLNFDESKAIWVKQVFDGRSIEELADLWAGLLRYLVKLADEARTLLDSID